MGGWILQYVYMPQCISSTHPSVQQCSNVPEPSVLNTYSTVAPVSEVQFISSGIPEIRSAHHFGLWLLHFIGSKMAEFQEDFGA